MLLAQDFAGLVEPDDFVLRLEYRIPVAIHILVGTAGGNRGQRAAGAFAAGIAHQLTHHFVRIAEGDLGGVFAQALVVVIGPEGRYHECKSDREKEDASSHRS